MVGKAKLALAVLYFRRLSCTVGTQILFIFLHFFFALLNIKSFSNSGGMVGVTLDQACFVCCRKIQICMVIVVEIIVTGFEIQTFEG